MKAETSAKATSRLESEAVYSSVGLSSTRDSKNKSDSRGRQERSDRPFANSPLDCEGCKFVVRLFLRAGPVLLKAGAASDGGMRQGSRIRGWKRIRKRFVQFVCRPASLLLLFH